MNRAVLKAFIALIPACTLFAGSVVIWLRRKSISAFLQFVGTISLVIVVLTHVFEALLFFLGWAGDPKIALAIISP
jgi:uncharacterized Tic20 family protein